MRAYLLYKVEMLVKWNDFHILTSDLLKIKRQTEKKIFVDVGGFEKEIKKAFIDRIEHNEQTKDRNVEHYNNYIYCTDPNQGLKKLMESYEFHMEKAQRAMDRYIMELK